MSLPFTLVMSVGETFEISAGAGRAGLPYDCTSMGSMYGPVYGHYGHTWPSLQGTMVIALYCSMAIEQSKAILHCTIVW